MARSNPAERSTSTQFSTAILLTLLVLAVFSRAITHDLLRWDDTYHIRDNPHLNPVSLSSITELWKSQYGNLYIPIFYTTLGLLSAISQSPWIFHAMNVALHVANTLLAWRLIRLLLIRNRIESRAAHWQSPPGCHPEPYSAKDLASQFQPDASWSTTQHDINLKVSTAQSHVEIAAAIGAAIFAVHPIQVESVAWISEMRGLLATFFGLLAILAFINRKPMMYALATIALIAAILSKPSAAIVPILAILIDLFISPARWRTTLFRAFPWLVIGLAIMILTKHLQPAANTAAGNSLISRPLVAADALGFYLTKILAPLHFSPDYSRTPQLLLAGLWKQCLWLSVPAIAAIFVFSRNRFVRFMLAWFVIALFPVLGLIPFDYQAISTVADRYAYLPMIAIAAMAAAAVLRFPRFVSIALVLIAALGIQSFHQAGFWKNDATLFSHALEVNPSSALACNNLGYELQLQGKIPDAIDLYRRSISLRADNPMAWTNLGYSLTDPSEARRCFEQAIALNPKLARAHIGLGILLAQNQDVFGARREFTEAQQLEPRNLDALNNLAVTFLDDDPRRALQMLSQVLRIQTDNRIAVRNQSLALRKLLDRGNALLNDGRIDEAEADLRLVIQIDPSSAIAHNNLGLILIQRHRIPAAAAEFAKAVQLRPDIVDSKRNLAGAQLLLRRQSATAPSSQP